MRLCLRAYVFAEINKISFVCNLLCISVALSQHKSGGYLGGKNIVKVQKKHIQGILHTNTYKPFSFFYKDFEFFAGVRQN